MNSPIEIPLFPLQIVLYPTLPSRMQIFEQRYLRLVRESMANDQPFGIVPIVQGREVGAAPEIFPWGTVVKIQDFEQLPNGLLSVVVVGEQRLQVLNTRVEEDGLMVAQAEILPPATEEPISFAEDDLVDMLESLAKHMGVDQETFLAGLNKETLVWRLAGVLPVDAENKMSLLAMGSVEERLMTLKKWVIELRMRGGGTRAD